MDPKTQWPEIRQDAGRWENLQREIYDACRGWLTNGDTSAAAYVLAYIGDTTEAELAMECIDDGWLNVAAHDEKGNEVSVQLCTHGEAAAMMYEIIDRLREEIEYDLDLADACNATGFGSGL